MSLKDALREAGRAREDTSPKEVNTESTKAVNTESSIAGKQESASKPELVTITIRVPKAQRQHWQIEAKRQDTTITAAITEALNTRFGKAPKGN